MFRVGTDKTFSTVKCQNLNINFLYDVITIISGFVSVMYPHNPKHVHDRLDDVFKIFDECKEDEQRHFAYLLNTVAQHHPEVGKTCG